MEYLASQASKKMTLVFMKLRRLQRICSSSEEKYYAAAGAKVGILLKIKKQILDSLLFRCILVVTRSNDSILRCLVYESKVCQSTFQKVPVFI